MCKYDELLSTLNIQVTERISFYITCIEHKSTIYIYLEGHITYILVNDWFPTFFALFPPLFFLYSFISLVICHYYTGFAQLAFCYL